MLYEQQTREVIWLLTQSKIIDGDVNHSMLYSEFKQKTKVFRNYTEMFPEIELVENVQKCGEV